MHRTIARFLAAAALLSLVAMTRFAAAADTNPKTAHAGNAEDALTLIHEYEREIVPLATEVGKLGWAAALSGKAEDFEAKEAAEKQLLGKLGAPERFARLKAAQERSIDDRLVRREIELLYLGAKGLQIEPALRDRIVAQSNIVEREFATTRPTLNGHTATDNQVREILRHSQDSAARQAAWEASKRVGRVVEADLKQLVRLRNQAAQQLGYGDFQQMQLALGELDRAQLMQLFDQLDDLTRAPFRAMKRELDAELAQQSGVSVEQLRPWHYHDPFFQEAAASPPPEFEAVYQGIDPVDFCRCYYAGIGLPVDDVLARSDLYEKPGKNPHAFCSDLDRQGDVRVLANIVPGREWLSTMMHELGHSVYSSKNIPPSMPYILRSDAHALTTEGIAMMFERFVGEGEWLQASGVDVPRADAFSRFWAEQRRRRLLIFSRWCQVVFRFEAAMYANPDQDLNKLWWDLVERYQEVRRPEGRNEPDYAAKIHIATVPVYYQNYMLGELFAAQVYEKLAAQAVGHDVAANNPQIGAWLKTHIFAPGASVTWNELTRQATGEPLSAAAFARAITPPVRGS